MIAQRGIRLAVDWKPGRVCLQLEEPELPLDPVLLRASLADLPLALDPSAPRELATGLAGASAASWAVFEDTVLRVDQPLVGTTGAHPRPGAAGYVVSLLVIRDGSVDVDALGARLALAPLPIVWNGEELADSTWEPPRGRRLRPPLYPADCYWFGGSEGIALRPPSPARTEPDPARLGEVRGDTRVFYRWFHPSDGIGRDGSQFALVDPELERSWLYPVQFGVLLERRELRLDAPGIHLVCDAPTLRTEPRTFATVTDARLDALEAELAPTLRTLYLHCLEVYSSLKRDQSGTEIVLGMLASTALALPVGGAIGSFFGSPGLGAAAFAGVGALVSALGRVPLVRRFSWGKLHRARLEQALHALRVQ